MLVFAHQNDRLRWTLFNLICPTCSTNYSMGTATGAILAGATTGGATTSEATTDATTSAIIIEGWFQSSDSRLLSWSWARYTGLLFYAMA